MRVLRKCLLGLTALLLLMIVAIYMWPEKTYHSYQPNADYIAQTESYHVPDMPDDWRYDYFTAQDGTRIRWGETGNQQTAIASIIFVPGYTSTLEMYGDPVRMLVERGYHVIGYDIRGQGGSGRHRADQPEKLYVTDFSVYGDDLAEFILDRADGVQHPLIIMGSSFGGAVATRAVGDHDLPVDGLVLLAPAYEPNTAPYSLSQINMLATLARIFNKSERHAFGMGSWQPDNDDLSMPSDCSSYPPRLYLRDVVFTRHPELRVGGVTSNWLEEIIENGKIVTRPDYMEKLAVPITMVAADNDVIINSAVSETACETGFPNCKLIIPEGTGHCLTLEDDRNLNILWDAVDDVLARVNGASGAVD